MARRERCWNDNHGRATVTVRFCPNCGEILNAKIPAQTCSEENHAKRRRARDSYCLDCGERLIEER